MSTKAYFLEKVRDINYRIATHRGDANTRLASEAAKISLLPEGVLPPKQNEELLELKSLIKQTMRGLPEPGSTPTRLGAMRNATAVKYIKMLIDSETDLLNEMDREKR